MRYRFACVLVAATASAIACTTGTSAATLVRSTFDTDLDGWTSNTRTEISWSSNGGNPGGYVKQIDSGNYGWTNLIAPDKFLSTAVDYSKLDGRAYFTWQHALMAESNDTPGRHYEIWMSGPEGEAQFVGGYPNLQQIGVWKTVVAPLLEADWTVTGGTWNGLLANVTSIRIAEELVQNQVIGSDVEGIDNVRLVSISKGAIAVRRRD